MTKSRNSFTTMTLLVSAIALSAFHHSQVVAEPPSQAIDPFAQSDQHSVENKLVSSGWRVAYRPVPELLRMHVPELQHDLGLLVCQVPSAISADQPYDLSVGDIVLAYAGRKLRSDDPLPPETGADVTIIRQGRLMTQPGHHRTAASQLNTPRRATYGTRSFMFPLASSTSSTSSASSTSSGRSAATVSAVASGNESVAVSQSGDQIAVDMSLPQLSRTPIRLRGTRQQILHQIESDEYSPAVRKRVLDAIR